MKKLLLVSFAIVSAVTASAGTYAGALQTQRTIASTNTATTQDNFKLIHVEDLQTLMTSSTNYAIFDANSPDTRKTEGMIPGAKPLTSSSHYSVTKELPTDKTTALVFYCANTACMASHAAASRATQAGYQNVSVMADGIQGWNKKVGKKTGTDTNS